MWICALVKINVIRWQNEHSRNVNKFLYILQVSWTCSTLSGLRIPKIQINSNYCSKILPFYQFFNPCEETFLFVCICLNTIQKSNFDFESTYETHVPPLDQRITTQITPWPIFYHNLQFLDRGREAISFRILFRPFLPSAFEQKDLKVF